MILQLLTRFILLTILIRHYEKTFIKSNFLLSIMETFFEYNSLFKYIDLYLPFSRDNYLLKEAFRKVLEKIAVSFNFDPSKREAYQRQFYANRGRDVITIVQMLLPFIKDVNLLSRMSSLQQVFDEAYSNRAIDFYPDKAPSIEDYLTENLRMLLKSIDLCSNKLYINWITVRPILDYKTSPQYLKTVEYFAGTRDDPGIYIGDIYNTIACDLYQNVKRVKWLLYEFIRGDDIISFDDVVRSSFFPQNENEKYFRAITEIENGNTELLNVVKYALVYCESYYSIKSGNYKRFNKKVEEEDEKQNNDFNASDIPDTDVINNFKAIGSDTWYQYLNDVYRIFGYTWYSKTKHVLSPGITRKNIYHFAKSFYMRNGDNWGEICYIWDELGEEQKETIIRTKIRIDYRDIRWFNTSRYLQMLYGNNVNVNTKTSEILSYIYENLADLVLETMSFKGTLTEYLPSEAYGSQNRTAMAQGVKKLDKYADLYYYLTGKMFREHEDGKYLENVARNNWFYIYALDWLSQINFFNKMYHCRINYITGGTGVGKSTQAPKLLLYGCIMLYYKSSAKIICSQPRIPPTQENAKRIAEELGVSLNGNNFYMQFQHSGDNHIPRFFYNSTFLKIVTDGSLLEVMKANLTMMQMRNKKELTDKNVYDVIIVDEAHEHNKNMDLILSLVKYTMKINKSIKLAIISATMEDDEPRYRNYYRDIKDIIQVPINLEYNRLYQDRRIHISPFGQLTRSKVEDLYEVDDVLTYEEAENRGILKVLEIANRNPGGEILFFSVGSEEIKNIVGGLNEKLPDNFIALPYFSTLPDTFKNCFGNIGKNLKEIKYKREFLLDIFDKYRDGWNRSDLPYSKASLPYKNAVIVATNVAEASITIDTLKFVVDTGFNKKAIYNPNIGLSPIVSKEISEPSRLQRRGRVGRVMDGTVYYMYKKGARAEIISDYDICTSDVLELMIELSCVKTSYLKSYQDVYKRYRKFKEFQDTPNFDITIDDLIDEKHTFHIIHPDELRFKRDRFSGIVTRILQPLQLGAIFNKINKLKIFNQLFTNEKFTEQVMELKRIIVSEQATLFNTLSLIFAHSCGREVFFKTSFLLLGSKLFNIPLKGNLMNEINKIEPIYNHIFKDNDFTQSLDEMEVWYGIDYLYHQFSKRKLPSVGVFVNLTTVEQIFAALFLSYPLNVCDYKLRNIYSSENVELQQYEKYSYLCYFEPQPNKIVHFPVNSSFIENISL